MHFRLSCLPSFCLLALICASGHAAEAINLRGLEFKKAQQQFPIVGTQLKAVGGISPNTLQLVRQHQDKQRLRHFRFQQKYEGFDVLGGYAIVHSQKTMSGLMSASNHQVTMNGVLYSDLATDLGKPDPQYVEQATAALNAFAKNYLGQKVTQKKVSPVIYIDSNHQAHWAYKVSLLAHFTDRIPARPTAILDAETFKPWVQWNDMKTALKPAKARGFGGNKKMGEVVYGGPLYPHLDIRRDDAKNLCYMQNDGVKVIDMQHQEFAPETAMQFPCDTPLAAASGVYWTGYQADGYDRSNDGFSPSNDALYAGYVINHLYKDWFDVYPLSDTGNQLMKLVMRVHYGENYENAFWDGEQMTFGDGEDFFYPLVSLGIAAHEISHGFTEQHANLQYYGQSGAMNESFSDMAAQAAEFYALKQNSWLIGSEVIKSDLFSALRDMEKPSRDGSSIDTVADYHDDLDVHDSSGVFNRLFYLIANTPGWDTKKAFSIMVKANMDYWTPYSSFDEGACGVLQATKDLNYSTEDVHKALQEVGINAASC